MFYDGIFQGATQAGDVRVGAQQQDRSQRRGHGGPNHRHRVFDAGDRRYIRRYRVGKPRVGDARHLQGGDARDAMGKPVDRLADRSEDAENRDEIHRGDCHDGNRGDRAPPMHGKLTQAEHSKPARRG
jgi:hypothetical protein